jgi:hypothetical protein
VQISAICLSPAKSKARTGRLISTSGVRVVFRVVSQVSRGTRYKINKAVALAICISGRKYHCPAGAKNPVFRSQGSFALLTRGDYRGSHGDEPAEPGKERQSIGLTRFHLAETMSLGRRLDIPRRTVASERRSRHHTTSARRG